MWQDFLGRFTKLGDPLLLLLGSLGVFFYLWIADERRDLARSLASALALCVLLTVAGKVVLHLVRWNDGNSLRLLSPSGHVAIGTGFYGCCAIMLTARSNRAVRVVVCTGTALFLGVLASSRFMLGLHSVPEIMVAFAIGGASLVVFTMESMPYWRIPLNPRHVVSLVILIFVAYSMHRVDGESLIIRVVQTINANL